MIWEFRDFDYEKMKEKLQVRICDQEWNEERLADKVVIMEHGDFLDAYYAVNLEENEKGIGSIPVTTASDERMGSICRTDSGRCNGGRPKNVVSLLWI